MKRSSLYSHLASAWLLAAIIWSTQTMAASVYVTSSGNTTEDALVQRVLSAGGHTVTLGDAWYQQDASQSLAGYEAVLLLNNYNWSSNMSVAGQQKFVDYVNGGGGLVTSEWWVWRLGANPSTYTTIAPLSPAAPNNAYNGATSTTYSVVTFDPVIGAGMPSSFTFGLGSISGTETRLVPRNGAVEFYSSSNGGGTANSGGLVGWDYGSNDGRVISFSTLIGLTELGNADYARLLNNSVNWAAASVPVPSSFWLLGSALAFFARRFARKSQ